MASTLKNLTYLKDSNRDFHVMLDSIKTRIDAPVLLTSSGAMTGDDITINEDDHAGKILVCPDFTGNATCQIPTPTQAGIHYNFVSSGVADDAHNLVFNAANAAGVATADAFTMTGAILDFDEDLIASSTDAGVVPTYVANGDDDKMTFAAPHAYNVHFISTSTTNFLITGWHIGDTAVAFGDQ